MYSRNKSQDEIAYEETVVWTCTNEDCSGWMRDNFAFELAPTCWNCQSPMTSSTKKLPLLVNNNQDMKEKRKGIAITAQRR